MARTPDGVFWIEDVTYGKWSADHRNRIIFETARADRDKYGNTVQIYGEQEGGSAGKEVSEQFIKMLAGFPVYREIVSGRGTRKVGGQTLPGDAKVIRAQGLATQAEAGNVRIRRAKFTEDRVSTKKQGMSGLGLEGQQAAVADYAKRDGATLVYSYTEVESGKRADNRPELQKAIAPCPPQQGHLGRCQTGPFGPQCGVHVCPYGNSRRFRGMR